MSSCARQYAGRNALIGSGEGFGRKACCAQIMPGAGQAVSDIVEDNEIFGVSGCGGIEQEESRQ